MSSRLECRLRSTRMECKPSRLQHCAMIPIRIPSHPNWTKTVLFQTVLNSVIFWTPFTFCLSCMQMRPFQVWLMYNLCWREFHFVSLRITRVKKLNVRNLQWPVTSEATNDRMCCTNCSWFHRFLGLVTWPCRAFVCRAWFLWHAFDAGVWWTGHTWADYPKRLEWHKTL